MRLTERLKRRFYYDVPGWCDGNIRYGRLLERHIPLNATVLDVGPGDGGSFNHATYLAGRRIIGIDPDPSVRGNPHLTEAAIGRVEAMPFSADAFDAVVSSFALEHINNVAEAAREIHRVLKPRGVFIFRTPNRFHYVTLFSQLTPHRIHKKLANWARNLPQGRRPYPAAYRCNKVKTIVNVFCPLGFRIVTLHTVEPEPSYMQFSPLAFVLGLTYERIVNGHPVFEPLRATILGALQKAPET